ncbi:MAG TPA: Asp-tRNA(Asn)/Glu-tRNA(Gln) amidotransferase subunit GatC [Bacteroidia bacterium]|jgi:aspartyl-tRNA(Asn)/glutamyl-tRNA(Gln) amidotransferase subunit C|nr:Asp-tRNA(Asn)/Glu-tRNA(Gln) amidotransferase subunit GatC [Bacteroidia bacterium]
MAQKIDIKTVDEIAHLARLEFKDEAKAEILNDMNRMLAWVDKLNELDTDKVEPLIYMSEERSVLREDEVKQTLTQKQALQNAPKKDSDYFKVPKVIDHP